MMRFDRVRGLALLSVATVAWGCSQPPQPEIDAATTALQHARASQTGLYASQSMREAEQAKAALDGEMQAQARAWLKSYGRARRLALEAADAADRAAIEAAETRDRAHTMVMLRRSADSRRVALGLTASADVLPPPKSVAPAAP